MTIYVVAAIVIVIGVVFFLRAPAPYARTTFDAGVDGTAAAIHLPIEPYGLALFVAADSSPDSTKVIDEVVAVWPVLWPKMLAILDTQMKDYGVETVLGRDKLIGSVKRMTAGVYMADQSDIMIRLEFEEPPLWDFFIRGSSIAHAQPVF